MNGIVDENTEIYRNKDFFLEDSPVSLLPNIPTKGTREITPNSNGFSSKPKGHHLEIRRVKSCRKKSTQPPCESSSKPYES